MLTILIKGRTMKNKFITSLILVLVLMVACDKSDKNTTKEKSYYEHYKEKVGIKDSADYERLEKENAEIVKKKSILKEKYEQMIEYTGTYLYEKEERLLQDGFKQFKSGLEDAPDGSTQVKQYYYKYEDGFKVCISLQSSYSISSYYVVVWIE